ncbi:uncharacterized protein Fot_24220 [Forsythia ovata]|uniref:PAP/OAS1 substrate-binding-related domain-containing protein n=1 Tax=Forsythia ovata TaxID=205694 RepID=A0ABD1U5L7_9LAMI
MATAVGRRILSVVSDFSIPDGALHFIDRNSTVISYGLQTNSTPLAKRGSFEDPTFKFQIPLQLAAEREIARSLIGAEPPRKDSGELLFSKLFLDACSSVYVVFPGGHENNGQPFVSKHFNVIDPLRVNNNHERSVSKGT